jgi:hypothetical protein
MQTVMEKKKELQRHRFICIPQTLQPHSISAAGPTILNLKNTSRYQGSDDVLQFHGISSASKVRFEKVLIPGSGSERRLSMSKAAS